jgi:hypothetical protein
MSRQPYELVGWLGVKRIYIQKERPDLISRYFNVAL